MFPVRGLDDDADMELVAGPVDAPFGEKVRVQPARLATGHLAAHIEARQVEPALAAVIGQERQIAPLPDEIDRGRLFPLEVNELREGRAAIRVRGRAEHGHAVLAQDVHPRAGNRLAAVDGLDEEVVGAVGIVLHQDAQVGDQDQALVALARGPLLLRVPTLDAEEEQTAVHARIGLQIPREIKGDILRFSRLLAPELPDFGEAFGDVVLVELVIGEIGARDVAARLAHQVVDLVGQHTAELEPHGLEVPGVHGKLLLAAQAQDRAVVHDAELPRNFGHAADGLEFLGQEIAAEGLDAFVQFYQKIPAGRGRVLEAVQHGVFPVPWQGRELQALGKVQDLRPDLRGIGPAKVLCALLPLDRRQILGKDVHGQVFDELRFLHPCCGLDHDHLLGLVALVPYERKLHGLDLEEVVLSRYGNGLLELTLRLGPAALGVDA